MGKNEYLQDLQQLLEESEQDNFKLTSELERVNHNFKSEQSERTRLAKTVEDLRGEVAYYLKQLAAEKRETKRLKKKLNQQEGNDIYDGPPHTLKWHIIQSGLSGPMVARLAGLDRSTVYSMTNLGTFPRVDTAMRVCGVIGVGFYDIKWGVKAKRIDGVYVDEDGRSDLNERSLARCRA